MVPVEIGDKDQEPEELSPGRPARPAAVELAAAVLLVSGAIQLFFALVGAPGALESQAGSVALALAINFATIAIGLLVRTGRLWILAINYVAVLGFLDLLGAASSATSFMLALAEMFVLVVLLLNRPWFQQPGPGRPRA